MRQLTRAEFDALSYRLNTFETRQTEFEADAASIGATSGTLNAAIQNLSGSVDGHFVQLSGTINARFLNLTGSLISSVAALYTTIGAGSTASINQIYTTILAGTSASDSAVQASLSAGSTASLAAQYTMMIAGTSASDVAVQVSLKAGSTASLAAQYTMMIAGTSASDATCYTAVLAGTSASDAAVQTSLKAGSTASLAAQYTMMLAGTSASDSAVQTSLKAGATASLAAQYTMMIAGTSASDSTYYTAVMAGTSASDSAVQTSLKAGVTASFGGWGGNLSIAGSITGSAARLNVPGANASGRRDAIIISNFQQATADDGQRIRWQWNADDVYNAWIAARITNTSPGYLDPYLEFGVQETSTLYQTSVTGVFFVRAGGIETPGSITGSGDVTFGRNARVANDLTVAAGTLYANYRAVLGSRGDGQPSLHTVFGNTHFRNDADGNVGNVGAEGDMFISGSITGSGDATFGRNVAIAGVLDVNNDLAKFGSTRDGLAFIAGNSYDFEYAQDADATGYINYEGYAGGATRFRSLSIRDGKGAEIALYQGDTKQTYLRGALQVTGTISSTNDILIAGNPLSGTVNARIIDLSGSISGKFASLAASAGLLNVQVFTTSSAYAPTVGTNKIIVEMVGGGGGSGACYPASGTFGVTAGGASGVYLKKFLSTISATGSVVIGAAGDGGAAVSTAPTTAQYIAMAGKTGGDTVFFINNTNYLARGGAGTSGTLCTNTSFTHFRDGGYIRSGSTSADVTVAEQGESVPLKFSYDGTNTSPWPGGKGGSNPLGNGGARGKSTYADGQTNGTHATGYGGGGGGCNMNYWMYGQYYSWGGSGSQGVVIIYEYA